MRYRDEDDPIETHSILTDLYRGTHPRATEAEAYEYIVGIDPEEPIDLQGG